MSDLTMGGCFCGNTLYYMDFSQTVYKINIHTGKSTLVLGNEEERLHVFMELLRKMGNCIMLNVKDGVNLLFTCTVKEKKIKKYINLI